MANGSDGMTLRFTHDGSTGKSERYVADGSERAEIGEGMTVFPSSLKAYAPKGSTVEAFTLRVVVEDVKHDASADGGAAGSVTPEQFAAAVSRIMEQQGVQRSTAERYAKVALGMDG